MLRATPIFAVLLFVACGGSPAHAPTSTATVAAVASADDLSAMLESIRVARHLPALGAIVMVNGAVVAIGATGLRKVGGTDAVTRDDQWHLGSDSKAFTATLVGIAIDHGQLHFDDTLGSLFAGERIDPRYAGG